ncbi:hypothetical protein GIY23_00840 [Allosaccharopolyspora coralli]|uniref:Uncharacterized protein n=1 Tax=Allosaccharopolyspora coralli TaxID=2665642 RepID=A0A5Q3Q194_9PSEU|nr:hypothetical protein [Allosaccharopolyspora coralli]QGK68301.1 hypothetical protein GIY23_00840 [Allosaccharopolyspora coralli]
MLTHLSLTLAEGMRLSRLSYTELWTRCLALGGSGTVAQLRRHVEGDECLDNHEHNIIAQALNETYLEQGRDHPVAYGHLHRPPDPS